jgi:AcrR family transcriptional regulator
MPLSHPAQEKEKLILDAAQNRIARYGFSKVTMDEIAQDVGLAKASVYYYYPTKADIFRAVVAREQEKFLEEATAILHQSAAASMKLKYYVQHRISLGNQLLSINALNSTFWQESTPGLRELFISFSRKELETITAIVNEGNQDGEFVVADPGKTAELILHVLQGLRLRFLQATQGYIEPHQQMENFEKQTYLLLETLLMGLETRKGL